MFKLDEIYHPILARFYKYSLLISLTLTTICIIPAIYIVLTQSKQAKIFKFLLLNQLLWSYCFCFIYASTGFLQLFPIPAMYSSNLFIPIGPDIMHIILPLKLFISIGHTQSYFIICLYRMTYASAFNRFQAWFEDAKKLVLIVIGFLLILSSIIVVPFFIEKYKDIQLHQDLLLAFPELQELQSRNLSIIAAPFMNLSNNAHTYDMHIITIALFSYNIYIPTIYISILATYFIVLRQAFRCKDVMSSQTHKNYCILVRTQTAQVFSITTFLFIPYLTRFFIHLLTVKHGAMIVIMANFLPSYHLLAEILALSYFVKPYREYIRKIFGKLKWSHLNAQRSAKQVTSEFKLSSTR